MSTSRKNRVGRQAPMQGAGGAARGGFTILEILLAVGLLAAISTLTYMTFSTVTSAWKRGRALSDDIHHGEFVLDQLVTALRSAYYPDAGGLGAAYGMLTEDRGDGEYASDTISWVKLGGALIGRDSPLVGSPHRVKFAVEEDGEGGEGAAVRVWRIQGQPDDFDPETVEPVFLSKRVQAFNCRTAYQRIGDEIDWLDDWEETNRLPTMVELAIYLEPLDEGEDAVEIKRVIDIPVGPLSWR